MSYTFVILVNPVTKDLQAIYVPQDVPAQNRKKWIAEELGQGIDETYPMILQQSEDSESALSSIKYAEKMLREQSAEWQTSHRQSLGPG